MSLSVAAAEFDLLPSPGRAGTVASVAKATLLLHTFTPRRSVLSIRQLSEMTGIPRSTTHTLCLTLLEAGLLDEVPCRGYRLGSTLVQLAGQVIYREGLVDAAYEILERVQRRDDTEAHLAQLVDGWVVYAARATGDRGPLSGNRVGLRVAAHRSACGRAALSVLPLDDALARVRRCHAEVADHCPDTDMLAHDLATIRKRGYALDDALAPGLCSVAAPVLGGDGSPIGSVAMVGPRTLFELQTLGATAESVVRAAEMIGARLPHRAR